MQQLGEKPAEEAASCWRQRNNVLWTQKSDSSHLNPHTRHSYFTLGSFTKWPGTHTHTRGCMKLQQQASVQPSKHFILSRPDCRRQLLLFFLLLFYTIMPETILGIEKGEKKIPGERLFLPSKDSESPQLFLQPAQWVPWDSLSHYTSGPSHFAATAHAELQPGRYKD